MILAPRNFTTKKTKTGKLDAALLSKPSYVSVDDPYKLPVAKILRESKPDAYKTAGHDVVFKPAKVVKDKIYVAPFEHMSERLDFKKNYRDADGHVITEPRNFCTNPPQQTGSHGKRSFFSKQVEFMKDEYDYPRDLAITEMLALKAKEQEKPFSQRCRTWGGFNLLKDVLGENPAIPSRTPKP